LLGSEVSLRDPLPQSRIRTRSLQFNEWTALIVNSRLWRTDSAIIRMGHANRIIGYSPVTPQNVKLLNIIVKGLPPNVSNQSLTLPPNMTWPVTWLTHTDPSLYVELCEDRAPNPESRVWSCLPLPTWQRTKPTTELLTQVTRTLENAAYTHKAWRKSQLPHYVLTIN